ncbi:T/G mismatch-specific endonuclease [Nitrosospira sp. Nsp5]|nr:very short patch repair endonuclease [Nitrosospira multiformis]PTR09942.1 T/G mismatch-specific endonuclease [Nitrosospira sp. Nsp5]
MSRIRSINTAPEILVRSALHRMGFRFRLHYRRLPGKPDLVLPKFRTAIFVHGCFWHQHLGCTNARKPEANKAYWRPKLEANVSRFAAQTEELEKLGWTVRVIWECETKDSEKLRSLLLSFFSRSVSGTQRC